MPSPTGTHEVRAVASEPKYYYNPEKLNFSGVEAEGLLEIAAGPNNPVGRVWIDLTKESYGIHGTPEPALIAKSQSHGCVRLTNWDAEELSKMVKKGTSVTFLE
jgi:lipoprotein-anchoring transpeptidase ErfK/SrfK